MATNKRKSPTQTVIIPAPHLEPASLPWGDCTGTGATFKQRTTYSVTVSLTDVQANELRKTVLQFWNANKPRGGGNQPDNMEKLIRVTDPKYGGGYTVYAKTLTEFKGIPNVVNFVNGQGTKLDTTKFGSFGSGSEGRVAVKLSIFDDGDRLGVSLFLVAVKLTKYVPSTAMVDFGGDDVTDDSTLSDEKIPF